MGRPITIEELMASSERDIALPLASKQRGEEVTLRVRKISRSEYLVHAPLAPPGAEDWPPEEAVARERTWFDALTPEAREARRVELRDFRARIVALAALDPVLTLAQAQRLGRDVEDAFAELLIFSGFGGNGAGAEEQPQEPPPAA